MEPICPKLIYIYIFNINFFFQLGDNKKTVYTINDESEFGDTNENEVNEPSNAALRDFDNYLMDDTSHVTANNNNNVVYNQLYFEEPIQDNQNFGLAN